VLLSTTFFLIFLAKATNRILVLPRVVHYERFLPLWDLIDTTGLDEHVRWKESTYFSNPLLLQVRKVGQLID